MSWLEHLFPNLRGTLYRIVAPADQSYNCVAWAVGSTDAWWWPSADPDQAFWPAGVPRDETLQAILAMFETLGYRVCATDNFEPGFEKVALFTTDGRASTHVARQSPNAQWTSKLGQLECIEHSLRDLEGSEYGAVAVVMKRSLPT